jgi:Flp pilus assembly protein TadD
MMGTERAAAALAQLHSGAWLEAEIQARAALAVDPGDLSASLVLGLAIAAMGETERAAAVLHRVASLQPDAPHPCQTLATIEPPLPRTLVRRQFHACLRLSPANPRLRLAFADFLLEHGWMQDAEAVLAEAALAGLPDTAANRHLMGMAQAEQGHFQAAIGSFNRAVALDPKAAASWSNLGIVLKVEGRFEAAIRAHDQAVELDAENPWFRVNRAVALLQAGHWETAWQDYEWRLKLGDAPLFDLNRLLPSLADLGDLSGLTIVALHEEGFGDTLQFLRYLPLLAERGARVVACVPRPLARLMAAVPGVTEIVTDARKLRKYDFICPFFSLPRAFGTTVETIPPPPSLIFDPSQAIRNLALPSPDALQVGLVWAGQSRPWLAGFRTLDRRRSAGLAAFEPLAALPGMRFVSLQAGPPSRQVPPPGMTLFDPMAAVTDFADTAAIIAALDVVVSVDTSVVHLAGLLGKPVLMLDRYDGCWRWLSGRRDSPWYPNLTIFRQEQPDDWSAPMARLAASLQSMALFRGPSGLSGARHDIRESAFTP